MALFASFKNDDYNHKRAAFISGTRFNFYALLCTRFMVAL